MPYTKEEAQALDIVTLVQRFRSLTGTIAADETVGHKTPEYIKTNASVLEQEIRDRLHRGLNAERDLSAKIVYPFPVWKTERGGLARKIGDEYVFVEKPDYPGPHIGDIVPHTWDIIPIEEAKNN